MKYITKGNEPHSLVEHRTKEHACYDNIPTKTKKEIKEALLSEQGHVCCYCMKRIVFDDMKVEHWKPQRYVEHSDKGIPKAKTIIPIAPPIQITIPIK